MTALIDRNPPPYYLRAITEELAGRRLENGAAGPHRPVCPLFLGATMHTTQTNVRAIVERRIQRGTMSVTLLARKTGLAPSHVSNFLHAKRQLSIDSLQRILTALGLKLEIVPAHPIESRPTDAPGRAAQLPRGPKHTGNPYAAADPQPPR